MAQIMNSTVNTGTWVSFTFHNPLVHKVTNLFKNTTVNVAFRSTNIIYQQLQYHPYREPSKLSGIYKLQCMTCNKSYVGQSSRTVAVRYKEHIGTYAPTLPHKHMPFISSTNAMIMAPRTGRYTC
jgi:hypothetical protein